MRLYFSTPAYDYAPNPDKQWILQVTERMDPVQRKFTDVLMTKRLQTLQSIDEAIERVSLVPFFRLYFWTPVSDPTPRLCHETPHIHGSVNIRNVS